MKACSAPRRPSSFPKSSPIRRNDVIVVSSQKMKRRRRLSERTMPSIDPMKERIRNQNQPVAASPR
jgi:hypothetical protein